MALAYERFFFKCVHNLDIRINNSYVFGSKIVYVSCCDTQSWLKGFDPNILNLSKACECDFQNCININNKCDTCETNGKYIDIWHW